MNVVVPLSKDDPMSFWLVIIAIAAFAVFVLVVAWRSNWITWSPGSKSDGNH
jgi:Mg2+ and Co2+ transporter CorA